MKQRLSTLQYFALTLLGSCLLACGKDEPKSSGGSSTKPAAPGPTVVDSPAESGGTPSEPGTPGSIRGTTVFVGDPPARQEIALGSADGCSGHDSPPLTERIIVQDGKLANVFVYVSKGLAQPVDLGKALRMILVHDLVEAEAGDVPFFDQSGRREQKPARERAAIDHIRDRLGAPLGQEFHDLWHEFEDKATAEAKLAGALDNLEVQIQHNLASLESWTPIEYDLVYTKMDAHCAHDPFLEALCQAVKDQAEGKMRSAGVDVDGVRARLGIDEASA
jgi:putative hydrolase of HD superfamily